MEHPLGSLIIANIPRCLALIIRDRVAFNLALPKMETCFHFLMGWRKIVLVIGTGWIVNYLTIFKAYIHLGMSLDNIDTLDFCTPNIEKTSREKSTSKFSSFFRVENPNDVVEVIMIYRKK